MEFLLSHWIYLFVILAVIVSMVMRRDVVLVCVVGIFLIGLSYTNSLVGGTQTVFNALMTGGIELFDIMLVIALMAAMLKSLQTMGADALMVSPARKFRYSNVYCSFILLAYSCYSPSWNNSNSCCN